MRVLKLNAISQQCGLWNLYDYGLWSGFNDEGQYVCI